MLAPSAVRTPPAVLLLVLASCSQLPPKVYPPFAELSIVAEFVVPPGGELPVPSSGSFLVVHELRAEPQPRGERFGAAGERWWRFAPGNHVALHCRCRAYAHDGGPVPTAAEILPGATQIVPVQAP